MLLVFTQSLLTVVCSVIAFPGTFSPTDAIRVYLCVLGERRNSDQGKNPLEVLKAKTVIRWLNLPLKDPAAVGLETQYKVCIKY